SSVLPIQDAADRRISRPACDLPDATATTPCRFPGRRGRTRGEGAVRDLAECAEEHSLRYLLISFVDLFGVLRAKLGSAAGICPMQRDGVAFDGFVAHLDLAPADPDIFAIADPDSLTILPWQPEIGWLAADLLLDGAPLAQTPRQVLKRQLAVAAGK